MGKKNIKKTKKSAPKAAESSVAKKEAKRLVTMAALEAMTDSEDDEGMPPEGEWGADAKALKKAIESGAFETVLNAYKEGEDDESIEEVNIDVSDEEEGDDGSEDAGDDQGEEVEEVNEEEEEGVEEEEDDDEDEEEEVDDNSESDAPAKAADKPQHKKSVLASKDDEDDEQAEVEDDDDEKEEVENVNSKAIRVVTEDLIAVRNAMPWAESFAITPATTSPFAPGAEEPLDIHDDLKREVAFYDIAMEAALAAKKACEEASVPFSRPEDFFAEMVKTDEHMARIKDRLIFETKKMEAVAQRKANKEHKLRAKESLSNKLVEKAKRKKHHFQAVQDWAESAASQRGGAVNEKADEAFLRNMNKGPSNKRKNADTKYGYGGRKGRFKQNDSKDLSDMSGYKQKGGFEGGKKRTSNASSSKRPSKRARDGKRAKR